MKVKILSTGACIPEGSIDNAAIMHMVDTSDEWIVERTGIRQRRKALPGQATSDLAVIAARRALEEAKTDPREVDTIIVATSSPDRIVPPTAAYVQAKLGCPNAGAYDLIAACSGFVYALSSARAAVASGQSKRCLVIGAEILSRITNYKDRTTCILFGDGAGAALVGPSDGPSDILYSKLGCDGRLDDLIIVPGGGTALPEARTTEDLTIHMKGREIYRYAVPKFVEIIREALAACSLKLSDIRHFIPHQMNARMIEAVAERLPFPPERIVVNIDRFGNTSAASIPLALDESVRASRVQRGDLVLLSAMGAGITWGTIILRW